MEMNDTKLEQAFQVLETYEEGSSRGALMPIDEAVRASLVDPTARAALERRLIGILNGNASLLAKEYACRQLVLIGSPQALPPLGKALRQPGLDLAARMVLDAMEGPEAAAVLRDALDDVAGLALVGVIQSLGTKGDVRSVPALERLLKRREVQVVGAAATALGAIGTNRAGRALRRFVREAPATVRPELANAMLLCAERLRAAGERAETKDLLGLLNQPGQPDHVRRAAQTALDQADRF
jgi:HEAT repeat protein